MDLGIKLKPGLAATPAVDKTSKISYPGLSLSDKAAEQVIEAADCEVGDEYTATVRLRVSSRRKDEYGTGVGFEVLELNDLKEAEDEAEKEDAEEEKTLGYKRVKSAKEAPDMSAKDLED
jgi:hypothetical protein